MPAPLVTPRTRAVLVVSPNNPNSLTIIDTQTDSVRETMSPDPKAAPVGARFAGSKAPLSLAVEFQLPKER